jgi:RND family efflux transporter MFP subunit
MKSLVQKYFGHPQRAWGLPAALLVALALLGWWSIRHAAAQPATPDESADLPMASVARVTREDLFRQVTIPAEFRPYEEVELHAKVSGFVKDILVDFGDKVKAGQLLTTLEVPELRNELTNAIAMEQKAEADHTNAHLILTRLTAVNKNHPDLVAQQDLDTATANDQRTAAAIAAANADVDKFRTLVGYTAINAPFDGVVTWRYADPGALIQAGTSSDSQSMPLVRVSDNYRLRLDFPVSVQYVQYLHVGDTVDVRVDSLGGRVFTGKITRATGKVDMDTRNMFYEIEVPNADLEIAPGMYATVILKLEDRPNALAIPIQAVAAKSGSVLVVKRNQEIESRPVKLGIETADKYEVLTGLKEGDAVIVGNPRRFQVGQKVQTMAAAGLPGEP